MGWPDHSESLATSQVFAMRTSWESDDTRLVASFYLTELRHRVSVDREWIVGWQARSDRFGNHLALLQERQNEAQPVFCIEH